MGQDRHNRRNSRSVVHIDILINNYALGSWVPGRMVTYTQVEGQAASEALASGKTLCSFGSSAGKTWFVKGTSWMFRGGSPCGASPDGTTQALPYGGAVCESYKTHTGMGGLIAP